MNTFYFEKDDLHETLARLSEVLVKLREAHGRIPDDNDFVRLEIECLALEVKKTYKSLSSYVTNGFDDVVKN